MAQNFMSQCVVQCTSWVIPLVACFFYCSNSCHTGKKNLAASAMAGLASVENFAAVKLRKTANRDQGEVGVTSAGVSFSTPSISLIHIKGVCVCVCLSVV